MRFGAIEENQQINIFMSLLSGSDTCELYIFGDFSTLSILSVGPLINSNQPGADQHHSVIYIY